MGLHNLEWYSRFNMFHWKLFYTVSVSSLFSRIFYAIRLWRCCSKSTVCDWTKGAGSLMIGLHEWTWCTYVLTLNARRIDGFWIYSSFVRNLYRVRTIDCLYLLEFAWIHDDTFLRFMSVSYFILLAVLYWLFTLPNAYFQLTYVLYSSRTVCTFNLLPREASKAWRMFVL